MTASSDRFPNPFPPPWADAWGDDQHGLWAEFAVEGVRQRMRWLEPGEFWMGSPEYEAERNAEREGPRHRVAISGFWLADTACTQAFWQTVMKDNPSHFRFNAQQPVERVSWLDAQRLFEELARLGLPGADLPTEAQWEYACRAGTETVFHFGDQINTSQANYNGNYHYTGGVKGDYRQRTLPVKELPANAWGLFQMHGNVREWCKDGLRKYKEQNAVEVNPTGPNSKEALPAVRGGSWIFYARYLRAAFRFDNLPDDRLNDLGLRLVLSSTSPASGPQAATAEQARGKAKQE